jgi:hypothetical protein
MDFDDADEMIMYSDYDEERMMDFYLDDEMICMDICYDDDDDDDDEESEGMITVNPKDLRFTQDSIALCFQSPHENWRIDDAVDMIVSKKLSPKSFPKLSVVRYQGTLWSLDNRRLWVFRKAHVVRITVLLDPDFESHPRIVNLKSDRSLMARCSCESYFPRVRGTVRQYIDQQELQLPAAAPPGFLDPENWPRLTPASTSLRSAPAACSRASHIVIDIDERPRTPSSFRQVPLHAEIARQTVDSEHAADGGTFADRQQLPRTTRCFPGTDPARDSERHDKKVRNVSLDDLFPTFQRPWQVRDPVDEEDCSSDIADIWTKMVKKSEATSVDAHSSPGLQVAPTTLAADELMEAIKEPQFHSTATPPAASPPRHVCLEVATFNVHYVAPFEHESMGSKATVQDTNYTGAATPEGTEIPKVGAEGEIHTPEAEEEIPNPDAKEETPNPEAEGEIPTPDSEEDHIPNAGTEVRCGKLYRFFYWLISSVLKLFGIEC